MTKAFLKYLLTLCILLLSGYSHLHAHTYQGVAAYAPLTSLEVSAFASYGTLETDQDCLNASSSTDTDKILPTEKNLHIAVSDIEEKEEEFLVTNKFAESGSYLSAVFYAFTAWYLFRYLRDGLLCVKHFSPVSSYRWHIMIQVFRI